MSSPPTLGTRNDKMKNLCAALFLYLGLLCAAQAENVVGPTNQIYCNKAASVTVAAAGTNQAIAGVAGQSIQFCGWEVTSGASAAISTFQFEYGTGSTCTSPTVFTPALNISSNAP